jgi:hypothetical protein
VLEDQKWPSRMKGCNSNGEYERRHAGLDPASRKENRSKTGFRLRDCVTIRLKRHSGRTERSEVRSGIQEKAIISKISGFPDEPGSPTGSRPVTRVLAGMT